MILNLTIIIILIFAILYVIKGLTNSDNFEGMDSPTTNSEAIANIASLYNEDNMTFGVADLLVRSDWINKLFDDDVLSKEETVIKAPNLNGDYHYITIDIKWTTLLLCANGKSILISQRFPAYKGQLAIYNAAVGKLQGYTPAKAFILAKGWNYTSMGRKYKGYNCFELLGEIDYDNFDILIVDNSETDEYMNEIMASGLNAVKGKWFPGARDRIVHSRNLLKDYALKNDYEHFFSLEQDVIPEPDVLKKLI